MEVDGQRSFSTKVVFEVSTVSFAKLQLAIAMSSEVLGLLGWLIRRSIELPGLGLGYIPYRTNARHPLETHYHTPLSNLQILG
jgi:hypothetical protein